MSATPAYDVNERRDTALARALKARIRAEGPLPLDEYIRVCHFDAAHGYYATRTVIGAKGDFVTAPEISQVFGELLGLWCGVVWQGMGAPGRVRLIELGPGRGTLMQDVLRVARKVPGFYDALDVHLVEAHPGLRRTQQALLDAEAAPITWQPGIDAALDEAGTHAIVLANEFVDALPVKQAIRRGGAWREQRVGLDVRGELAFVDGPAVVGASSVAAADECAIQEFCSDYEAAFGGRNTAVRARSAVWLFVDYGHAASALGDSLQAVRNHRYEHPLCSPGEADLSAQVDFQALSAFAASRDLVCDGPVTQAQFLGTLGILQRASRLMAANPALANSIESGVARLMSPNGMGTRFKVLGVRSPTVAPLPALVSDARSA